MPATIALLAEAHMWLLIHPQTIVVLFSNRRPTSRLVTREDELVLFNRVKPEYTDSTDLTLLASVRAMRRTGSLLNESKIENNFRASDTERSPHELEKHLI